MSLISVHDLQLFIQIRCHIFIDCDRTSIKIASVVGDTNSPFVGALCAAKSGIKDAHVEAGAANLTSPTIP
jgi:hypothetical protein